MAITREYLKELGIEEEAAKKIMAEHGSTLAKAIETEKAKFADYDDLKSKYETQGKEIEKLRKLDPTEVQKQIDALTETHKTDLETIKTAHTEALKKMAVKMQLTNAQDVDLVLSQLDLSKVEMDEENNVKGGLEEQYKALQESKPFLFKQEKPPTYKGFKPKPGEPSDGGDKDPFIESARQGAGLA